MFAKQYKKRQLYDAHEKSISDMIEKINKMLSERLNNLSQEIRTISDLIKQLKGNTRDLEDLVKEKLDGHVFFLSVRKLKDQPSNKLLLALFFIQTVKEGNIRE